MQIGPQAKYIVLGIKHRSLGLFAGVSVQVILRTAKLIGADFVC